MVAPGLRPDGDIAPEELRAMITATSAALRLPFGATRIITVSLQATGNVVAENKTSRVMFVELRVIPGQPPITLLIGPSSQLSPTINQSFVFPAESPVRFMLYPSETLYARGVAGGQAQVLRTEVFV